MNQLSKLCSHAVTKGTFHPYTYCIGLSRPLEKCLKDLQTYPITGLNNPDKVESFKHSLTLLHELTHLAQFAGTSFGLTSLRTMNIACLQLMKNPGWDLPVLPTYFRKFLDDGPTEHASKILTQLFIYLDVSLQLTVTQTTMPSSERIAPSLRMQPWTPHYQILPKDLGIDEYTEMLRRNGANIHDLPWLQYSDGLFRREISITAATLMEAGAYLMELNQVYNAIGIDGIAQGFGQCEGDIPYDWLPSGMPYIAPIIYAFENGVCTIHNMVPVLLVLIDLSLMYDLSILCDSPIADMPKTPGMAKHMYPGEVFVEACKHVKNIPEIESGLNPPLMDFYSNLCKEMEIPSPRELAEGAFAVVERLIDGFDEKALFYRAFRFHYDLLEWRLSDPTHFPLVIPMQDELIHVLELAKEVVTIYDLDSKKSTHFNPHNIDCVSTHSILMQALTGSLEPNNNLWDPDTEVTRLECPLKSGVPFRCDSHGKGWSHLCKWSYNDNSGVNQESECLVDVYEKFWKLRPPH